MDSPQEFESLQDQIQDALITITKTTNRISSEDLSFQRSLDPTVGTSLDEQSARLLALSRSLLKSAGTISDLGTPTLQGVDDVDNNWKQVVDVVDSLLEKADICLDEYTGVIKRKAPLMTDQDSAKSRKNMSGSKNSYRNQNLVKPQLAFKNKPDNTITTPWKPILTSKPHATISLEQSLGTFTNELGYQQYRHPYETEILQLQYPNVVYQQADPVPYQPAETTSATFVDTLEDVLSMLAELKMAKEIAVDLEHHDTRSYVGLTSLMQISTRDKDWIVDTLKPWREDLQVLNEVFTDPKIIKVLHGAYMDIIWLQRDLGLYIVGLFDTHHATRVLGYPGGSLAYLLKRFINFDADKKYQMADWRIRPLPDEMFFYARADTHYLLYIYDNLRNELVNRSDLANTEENSIELVIQKSKETSSQRFERQIYDTNSGKGPGGWYTLLLKTPAHFTNEQFAVFRAVHAWRDKIARQDDESTTYVMTNNVLFTLARLMPMDMVALYGSLHPVSHSVKSRATALLALIQSARASGKDGPSMMDVFRSDPVGTTSRSKQNSKSIHELPSVSIDQGSLRSEVSMFWGTAFGSSIWDPPARTNDGMGLKLAVPLPRLASDTIDSSSHSLADRSPPTKDQSLLVGAQPATTMSNTEDGVFTIKSGRKRKIGVATDEIEESKSKDVPVPNPAMEPRVSPNREEGQEARDKAALKAEKRARKKLAKAQRQLAQENGIASSLPEESQEEDFDYSKAESVLHGPRKDDGLNSPKGKKPFDPYSKSSDAPKGMRRLQTERTGKSYTFKS